MQQEGEKLPYAVRAAPAKTAKSPPRKPRGGSPRPSSPKGGRGTGKHRPTSRDPSKIVCKFWLRGACLSKPMTLTDQTTALALSEQSPPVLALVLPEP
eukprot:1808290-Prorocentrum_lima.AAC.1